MYEYILFFEGGEVRVTEVEEKWDGCSWPTVIRTWVSCGDYGVEYEKLSHENEWVKLNVDT